MDLAIANYDKCHDEDKKAKSLALLEFKTHYPPYVSNFEVKNEITDF